MVNILDSAMYQVLSQLVTYKITESRATAKVYVLQNKPN